MVSAEDNRIGKYGFTLAELLIALGILGVISVFTIPKVLQNQRNTAWNASAKEAAATISSAYTAYKQLNTASANTSTTDLVQYLNYVKRETSAAVLYDHITGAGSLDCSGGCFRLHNGGILAGGGSNFGGTTKDHYIHFLFDPDGRYSGSPTGPGKSVTFDLHFNGRITSGAERQFGVDITWQGGSQQNWGPDPAADWFVWNN